MIRFVFDFFGRQHARKGLGFDWRCSLIEATPHLQMIFCKTYENQDRFKSLYNFSLKRPPSLPHTLSQFIFRPNLTTTQHASTAVALLVYCYCLATINYICGRGQFQSEKLLIKSHYCRK